jgi:hypothetical protein
MQTDFVCFPQITLYFLDVRGDDSARGHSHVWIWQWLRAIGAGKSGSVAGRAQGTHGRRGCTSTLS